jgi:NAD(P)-dependent dehydrogenase (short-subunit alcohol dehydrogenase family)
MNTAIDGKVAWVTGAGSGIGQAAAIALGKAGARLILSGRRAAPLEETAAAIRDAGGTALVAPADMADPAAVAAIASRIRAEHGRCDILVNSAGLNIRWRSSTPRASRPSSRPTSRGRSTLSPPSCR